MSRRNYVAGMVALVPAVIGLVACATTEPTDGENDESGSLVESQAQEAAMATVDPGLFLNEREQLEREDRALQAALLDDEAELPVSVHEPNVPTGPLVPMDDCNGQFLGTGSYCTLACTCEHGEGDCDSHDECSGTTMCMPDVGETYGFNPIVDVCVEVGCHGTFPGRGAYCSDQCQCSDGEGDCDNNGECVTGTYCKPDVGADYGFAASVDVCVAYPGCHATVIGRGDFCTDLCLCNPGEGDCDSNAECAAGLRCVSDVGADYGFSAAVDVCESPLIISEYVEGTSYNKAIEIYNFSGSAFDLTGCALENYTNGSATVSASFSLTGSVPAGGTFVVCDSLAVAGILDNCDSATTSQALDFNGDDAVVLTCSGYVVDVIGQIGYDPGTQWGTGDASTADNTIRRKATVCSGDHIGSNAFDPATEWDGFATDVFDGLGSHTETCP